MLKQRLRNCSGFTLVELVVVVLILGVISAIVGPRLLDTASDASENSTKASLKVLRNAIELYKAKQGAYPPAATLSAALKPFIKGPFPKVQVGNKKNANVAPSNQNPIVLPEAGGAGWAYNQATGEIVVNKASFIAW